MSTQLFEPRRREAPPAPPSVRRAAGRRWLERLLDTTPDVILPACRLILGGVMLPHACQKVFGWFGGPGFSGTVQGFRDHLGIPLVLAVLVILAEVGGSLSLILGFAGRIGAALITAVMAGAILLVHAPNGFFMNWTGKGPGEGYEYHLLAIGLALPILAKGSGGLSLDRLLLRRIRRDQTDAA